jgi:RNA polymerase sigma-70 factor (sigma-E family)
LRRRDDESFVAFVADRGTALLRTASLLCASRADAEDLLQTALEKTYRHWARLSTDSDPEPYVRRILVNLTISRARRWRILREVHMPSPPEVPAASETHTVELRGALVEQLRRLGPRQRAVLVLRYWEDQTEAEIARTLGCSVGTVKSQAARGLARLRELLDTESGDGPAAGRGRPPGGTATGGAPAGGASMSGQARRAGNRRTGERGHSTDVRKAETRQAEIRQAGGRHRNVPARG